MQTAQGKYTLAGRDFTIVIYFDLKAFDLLSPALTQEESDDFIRLICDSFAAALPKNINEKFFYIKRVLKNSASQNLVLLCTDGFLIDDHFILPISQQAYAKERIQLSEVEKWPARFNLNSETLKNIHNRLPAFEEAAHQYLPQPKIGVSDKTEKLIEKAKERSAEKTRDALFDLGHLKKEIKEISRNSAEILNSYLEKINDVQKNIENEVNKESGDFLEKKTLDTFTETILSNIDHGSLQKNKDTLVQKLDEITTLPKQFMEQFDEANSRINQYTQSLSSLKEQVIQSLYDAAREYQQILLPQLKNNVRKKFLIAEFNKKFMKIAEMSDSGEISSLDYAQEHLQPLSFDELQNVISREDKINPGLLQKCNTSWTEESPELKIVIRHFGKLNQTLAGSFKQDTQFSSFAGQEMTKITRIPFPRSFQFKFTDNFLAYKKMVEEAGRMQKDKLIDLSQQYKKTMQINEVINQIQRSLSGLQKQTVSLKTPILHFKDALKRKEEAAEIIKKAGEEFELTQYYLKTAQQYREKTQETTVISQLDSLIQDLQSSMNEQSKTLRLLSQTKSQIDSIIQQTGGDTSQTFLADIDEKIKLMENSQNRFKIDNSAVKNKMDRYDTIFKFGNIPTLSNEIKNLKVEAKTILLQFIQNKPDDLETHEKLKRSMIETYTHLDTDITAAEKMLAELQSSTAAEAEKKPQALKETWAALETTKNEILKNLSQLKSMSAQPKS